MKTKHLILLILLTAWNTLHAREYPALPLHPLSVYQRYLPGIYEPRMLADSIFNVETNAAGDIRMGHSVYKRSADGLTDSIYTADGFLLLNIYQYSPDGKLLSAKYGDQSFYFDSSSKWAYDKDGRLAVDTFFFNQEIHQTTTYTYKQDTVWIHNWTNNVNSDHWEEQISYHYTDSGYIEETIRREKQNNTIQTTTVKKEYIFDASNRLIREDNYHYTYFEDGGYMQSYEDMFSKKEKYYNNKGYLTKEIHKRPDPYTEEWVFIYSMEVQYIYNADNPNPNTPISSRVQQVYGVEGGMIIKSEVPEYISIYTISGQLVQRIQTTSGNQWIPLAKGIYVVTTESGSYKVMVR